MESYCCFCYYSHNIFLHKYRIHVTYFEDVERFIKEHREALSQRGCEDEKSLREVLEDVKAENQRRINSGKECSIRRLRIREEYKKLHPSVYSLSEGFFEPEFIEIVEYCKRGSARPEGLLELITEEKAPNVFSFPVFTQSFCKLFVSELVNFEESDLPKGRPNTMNRGGILLDELGFDQGFFNPLRENYLMPIAKLLYPEWVMEGLDSHRVFIVKYAVGEDIDLSYHFDNAEVTINVCLGTKFDGGSLYFGPMRTESVSSQVSATYAHKIGRGLFHRAQHMHGANPITSGERYNLIIWMRSSSVRNKLCPMCDKPPQLVPTEGPGDGYTKHMNDTSSCDLL